MTDSEYMEMKRLLDSLTDGANTLRVVFSREKIKVADRMVLSIKDEKEMEVRVADALSQGITAPHLQYYQRMLEENPDATTLVSSDKAKAHPDFKIRYSLLPDQDIIALVRIINECTDWTSDKFKASVVYQKMQSFISATSDMPKGISGMYKIARSKCLELMDLIPGVYPDLYPPIIRDLLTDPYYQQAVDHGDIIPPFTWTHSIKELAVWIDNTIDLRKPAIDQVEGKEGRRNWMLVDCVFRIAGEPVTAKQLRIAIKG